MAIISIEKQKVKDIVGNLTDKELDNKLNLAELGVERITDNEIEIEITPNRPDLLSIKGLERYLISYFKKPGIRTYKTERPLENYKVIIEKSVKKVRPYTSCAIIKGLKLNNEKIKEIIDLQEKLHSGYGRDRKKLAIGIYPLEKIKLPITFKALKPNEIKFRPLEFPREITGRQILSQHPTGREYGHLLEGAEVYPVFMDSNNEILSMPPIINSEKTGKVSENTKDVFIECSGFNKQYLNKTLNMIVCALADLGGKIYSMQIIDNKEKYLSPNLEPEKIDFSEDYIRKILGLELKEKDFKKYFEKMGLTVKDKKVLIPPYRTDILHEIDLAEEIAIAYGFNNIEPEIPKISTIGEEDKISVLKQKIKNILIGLLFQEISTYHLSTKEKQFKKLSIKEFNNRLIEVSDSKNENNILRTSLLSHSISTLSENSDAEYPQKIFETGTIFFPDPDYKNSYTGIGEKESLCISLCSEKSNFTEIKQILDYLMRMLDKDYSIQESENPSFIKGRCGEIFVNNKSIGYIGEISPTVLKNNKIKMPVASLEISIKELLN